MAFILIDEKMSPGLKIVKPGCQLKTAFSGDGVIDFVTVMDMDVHGLFVAVQMRSGKGTRFNTGAYALFTGTADFHGRSSLISIIFSIRYQCRICKISEKKHRN